MIEGENAGRVPCFELPAPMPDDPEGAIVGSNVGRAHRNLVASPVPDDPSGAIVGSNVGFVPGPCQQIIIGGGGNGIPPVDLATSPNGTTWTLRDPQFDGNTGEIFFGSRSVAIFGAAWGANLAVIGGGDRSILTPFTAQLATSPDGIDWTIGDSSFTGERSQIRDIAYAPELDRFVAVGLATRIPVVGGELHTAGAATSEGGIGWVQRTIPTVTDANLLTATWSPELGLFLIGGNNRYPGTVTPLATSPDGISWTARDAGFGGDFGLIAEFGVTCSTWSPELGLFLIGGDAWVIGSPSRLEPRLATSPNGATWTAQDAGFGSPYTIDAATWSPELGLFLITAGTFSTEPAVCATSPDGVNWTERFPGIATGVNDRIWAAAWAPEARASGLFGSTVGLFILGSEELAQLTISPNGIDWEEQETGFAGENVYCIAVPLPT